MYVSSCLIHQDLVEGRCLCRYSRWQEFGDIEYNIALQSAHSAYKTSGWNGKGRVAKEKGAQSKSVNSVADGKGMATRAMSQLQSHEILCVVESAVCRPDPTICV